MKLSIIDTNYSDRRFVGLSASWLRWALERRGIAVVEPIDADVWLMTASSPQGAPSVRYAIRRWNGKGKAIVLGGGGGYAPAVFDGSVTACCVGEGKHFIDVLATEGLAEAMRLPEAWVPGESRPVVPSQDFPWDCPPIMHPDGRIRVIESRGCRHKCLFCQTGWERHYIPPPDLQQVIDRCHALSRSGLPIDLVTNDAGHTSVINHVEGAKSISVRCDALDKIDINRLPRMVRIGVEGVSERLRAAVKKPISTDGLIRHTEALCAAGKSVKWFFICGLPLERPTDYEELDALAKAVRGFPKGVVQAVFHAYIPQPATPLCVFPLVDEYWGPFDEWRRRFFDGPIHSNRLQIIAPARYITRLKNSELSMACTEAELRRGWWTADNRNWRVKYLASPDRLRAVAMKYQQALL